jgi:hypothetical protein
MFDTDLMQRFNFNQADLELNRNGSLSPGQLARVRKDTMARFGAGRLVGLLLVAVGVVPAVVWALVLIAQPQTRSSSTGWLMWLIFSIILLLAFGGSGLYVLLSNRPKRNYPVKKVEGPVWTMKDSQLDRQDNASYTYRWLVGEAGQKVVEFPIGPELSECVREGDVYAIYYVIISEEEQFQRGYVPPVRQIVSLEKLADRQPPVRRAVQPGA